jgi:hypothetical protein
MFIITANGKNLFPGRKFVTEDVAWKVAILECECENWEVKEDDIDDDECECNEDWGSLPEVLDGNVSETWKLDTLLAKSGTEIGLKNLKEYAIPKIQRSQRLDELKLLRTKIRNSNTTIKDKLLGLIETRINRWSLRKVPVLEGKMKEYALKLGELKENPHPFLVKVKYSIDETLTFTFNKEDSIDVVISNKKKKGNVRNIAYSILMNRGYTEEELSNKDVLETVETLKNISVSPRFVTIVTNAMAI